VILTDSSAVDLIVFSVLAAIIAYGFFYVRRNYKVE
jgi:hypothetical protein